MSAVHAGAAGGGCRGFARLVWNDAGAVRAVGVDRGRTARLVWFGACGSERLGWWVEYEYEGGEHEYGEHEYGANGYGEHEMTLGEAWSPTITEPR
jgi:hypothetical protein